jgi:hypothetical protein
MTIRLVRGQPNLLWLEDRQSTARIELGEAKKLGCQIQVRGHPAEMMALLEEELGRDHTPEILDELRVAFVIDVMIAGLLDLSAFGIQGSETHGGLNGGYVFVDRVLRHRISSYRFRPVCFLSERELTPDLVEDLQYLRDRVDLDGRSHGHVDYIRKFNSQELARFKSFLGTL